MKLSKITLIILALSLSACGREWLEIKTDKKLVVPQTLNDLQAMLDNASSMNEQIVPFLGEAGSDDFFITDEKWSTLTPEMRNSYIWAADIYEGEVGTNWFRPYQQILYANTVLEQLERLGPQDGVPGQWANVKGSALFYRSWMFFHMAQVFCLPYHISTASTDPGLPLRLESDINVPTPQRSSLEETYSLILTDLNEALALLPEQAAINTRPAKVSAYALLARIHLTMGNYEEAKSCAQASLRLYSVLTDYNQLNPTARMPFGYLNEEVIFQSSMIRRTIFNPGTFYLIPELADTYREHDLRKALYFDGPDGMLTFKGNYNGDNFLFAGIAVDEMVLTLAEAQVRFGEVQPALENLNRLLMHRIDKAHFSVLSFKDPDELLDCILKERRKQLVFRGTRWMDIRRLNFDERFRRTLSRTVAGTEYTLPPMDKRFALPIPEEVILHSGIQQNPRD